MEETKSRIVNKIRIRVKGIENKYNIIKKFFTQSKWNLDTLKIFIQYILNRLKRVYFRLKNDKNYISRIIEVLLGSRLIIIWIMISLYQKTIFFYENVNLNIGEEDQTYFMTIIFLLITVCPLLFIRKNKNRFILAMCYNLILSTLLFADNLYWEYSVNMLSISQILYVKYAEEIGGALSYIFDAKHLLYFVDIPVFIIMWVISRILLINTKTKARRNRGKRRLAFGILCIICLSVFASVHVSIAYKNMADNPYLKLSQVCIGSIYGYHYLDIYNTINIKDTTRYKSYEKMISAYNGLSSYYQEEFYKDEEFKAIAEGKNVIVLQLESIQNFVAYRKINGKEITPNLNKFLTENIEVKNMISQSYSTTADSEYSVMTSLYPLENRSSI